MLGILKKTFSETCTFKKHELILTVVKEFQCNTCQSTCSEAGTLLVELFDPEPEQKYELTVKFSNWEEPLKFAVCLQDL